MRLLVKMSLLVNWKGHYPLTEEYLMKKLKTIFIAASLFIMSGCSVNSVNEDKAVNAEIYLIHSKMKSYDVIPEENKRIWGERSTIDDIIKSFPDDSAYLVYKTEVSSNWGKLVEKEEYDFINNTWKIKNKEHLEKAMSNKNFKKSSFKFKLKPLYFSDGRAVAEMRYDMKFVTSINSYKKDNETVYYPLVESFQDSKSIEFYPNKYYVFSTIPLKDKSSFILIYKLKN